MLLVFLAINQKNPKFILFCLTQTKAKVLDVIAPPEFHLLLGIVNHLVQYLQKEILFCQYFAKHDIKAIAYHGGKSFNGPSFIKLLQTIDKIEQIVQANNLKLFNLCSL